jgi:hypothetical protein
MGKLRKQLLGISLKEIRCEQRRFDIATPDIKTRIEKIGETFVSGYHAALINDDNHYLEEQLDTIALEMRGFAYEGAAMALALLDLITPWQNKHLQRFLQGPGDAHAYMVHVGAGWAMARIPWGMTYFNKLDALLAWLALDGYGFHQGYFNWPKYVTRQQLPGNLTVYQKRVFDQGLGRSLWFSKGAQIELMTAQIAEFAKSRQSDLWGGLGLAAAYAGGVNEADLTSLKNIAGSYLPHFAQGVAFAAKTRLRAGNPADHTEAACRIICEMSMDKAAKLTDDALIALPENDELPAYEHWRQRIQQNFIN